MKCYAGWRPVGALLALFMIAECCICADAPAPRIAITGRVIGSDGKPVPDVIVIAWSDGRSFEARAPTDHNGSYEVTIPRGEPINCVAYSKHDYEPGAVVEQLSGVDNHAINKVLYHERERVSSPQQAYDILQGYESIAFHASVMKARPHDAEMASPSQLNRRLTTFTQELSATTFGRDRVLQIKARAVADMLKAMP